MKSILFLLMAVCCCTFVSCEKNGNGDNDDPATLLASISWKAVLTDENPATNPPGKFRYVNDPEYHKDHQYFAWQECMLDDTFTFQNALFAIANNSTECTYDLGLIFNLANQPYAYDEESKQLIVGTGENRVVMEVRELNRSRLKIVLVLPAPTGLKYTVFLFKNKNTL